MTDRELNIQYRNVFERFIPKEYLQEMADYNDNDVYIVAELIRNESRRSSFKVSY